MMPCLICQLGAAQTQNAGGRIRVLCPRCGEFLVSEEAAHDWNEVWPQLTPRQRANVWGWIRQRSGVYIRSEMLDFLRRLQTPTVTERADRLLTEIERRIITPGQHVSVHDTDEHALDFCGCMGAIDRGELGFFGHNFLHTERRFLYSHGHGLYSISPDGYVHLEKLRQVNSESEIGFAAMWFDEQLNPLWLQGIEPGIRASRYRPIRIDRHLHNNRIDDEIVAMIRKSRFIVADFTGHRGGIYFEAGFALGLGLPVIWTCRAEDLGGLHFDTRQYNFLTWVPDQLPQFQSDLKNRIDATIGQGGWTEEE